MYHCVLVKITCLCKLKMITFTLLDSIQTLECRHRLAGGVRAGVRLCDKRVGVSPNKCAAANRRPALQSEGSREFQRDSCSRGASPAAVAELGRSLGLTITRHLS